MNEPRTIIAPHDLEEVFLSKVLENTNRGVESCGLLCGRLAGSDQPIHLTHLLIPPQAGTHNTVEMLQEELAAMYIPDPT